MRTFNKALCFCVLFSFSIGAGAESAKSLFDLGLEKFAKDAALRRNESPVQIFYSYKPKTSDENATRYVYWPEARFLLKMPNDESNDRAWENMILVTRFIDLEKDIVTKQEDIGTSTYLELESDMIAIVQKCLDGPKLTVSTGAIKRGPAPLSYRKM
jgi:hypothetical protein